MPKQIRFDQAGGQGAAVALDERCGGPPTQFVQRGCRHALAGAGFAAKQNSRAGSGIFPQPACMLLKRRPLQRKPVGRQVARRARNRIRRPRTETQAARYRTGHGGEQIDCAAMQGDFPPPIDIERPDAGTTDYQRKRESGQHRFRREEPVFRETLVRLQIGADLRLLRIECHADARALA